MSDHWRQRIRDVYSKLPVGHTPGRDETDIEIIAAGHLRKDDVFDFAGATLRAETITYVGSLVEIEAVGPFNITTVHYLPFETIKVYLPRPEPPA